MDLKLAYDRLFYALLDQYDTAEAANIAELVLERVTGQQRINRARHPHTPISLVQQEELDTITTELLKGRPVQYVLGQAWFGELPFYVNESVLIPRPETDELVHWVLQTCKQHQWSAPSTIDIGTGSGCIPITIKHRLPQASVHAVDISAAALAVAQQNAQTHHTPIQFHELNFLDSTTWASLPTHLDCIISNPPYVKQSESASMHARVLNHEPATALFVPDDDALIFYQQIAGFAQTHLAPNGYLFFEINEALGQATCALLETHGFSTELKQDMQGKDRMIRAMLSQK
jgi:release factor glutamine methyltransferase